MRLHESLIARLLFAFGTITVVFAAATAFSIGRLAHFNAAVSSVTGQQLHRLELADQWLDAVEQSTRLTGTTLITADEYDMPDYIRDIKSVDAKATAVSTELRPSEMSLDEATALRSALLAR